jgi:hypothetical protein
VRSFRHPGTPVWVLLIALLVLFTAGDIAAEATRDGPTGPATPIFTHGTPDTLYGGPQNPGHDGDPNDYDKTIPAGPVWLLIASWLMGIGR